MNRVQGRGKSRARRAEPRLIFLLVVAYAPAMLYEILRWALLPLRSAVETDAIFLGLVTVFPALGMIVMWHRWRTYKAHTEGGPAEKVSSASLRSALAEALPKGANLAEAIIQTSPVAIAIADRDHKIRLVSPAFSEVFGYGLAECIGRTSHELIVPAGEEPGFELNADLVLSGGVVRGIMKRKTKSGALV